MTYLPKTGMTAGLMMALLLALLTVSACGPSSGTGDGDCGDHGERVGGQCVCDPGYVAQNDTCVEVQDGDVDQEKADGDKTDGDADKVDGDEPDGDKDDDIIDVPDGDVIDGDLPDGDRDEEKPCYCPVIDGNFCVDPDIANPANYQIVEIRPGSKPGCTIRVSVRTTLTVSESEYVCAENGRLDLSTLGCTLFYNLGDSKVRLVCGDHQYNFGAEFCQAADGDMTDGDATDGDATDGDATDGDATDGDTADGDTMTDGDVADADVDMDLDVDGDVVDGDLELDQESDGDGDVVDGDTMYLCTEDSQCDPYHYCDVTLVPWSCVAGCHPETKPCLPGYECSEHGLCNPISGGDGDETEIEIPGCTLETEDSVCGYGNYCLIVGETGECEHDCWTNDECQDGFECNVPRGRCVILGGCQIDSQCEPQWFCNIGGVCQAGCQNSLQCGYNQTCDPHGRCINNPVDGDVDIPVSCQPETVVDDCGVGYSCLSEVCYQECATTDYCTANIGDTFICNEYGMCVQEDTCSTHEDCATAGFPKHFCSNGMCVQDCADNETCVQNFGLDFVCNEFGWCERVNTDNDVDVEFSCTDDPQCPTGNYCDLSTNTCTFDCTDNSQCAYLGDRAYCDLGNGRCDANIIVDGDSDFDYVELTECTQDEQCPQYWICQTTTGYCIDPCTMCPTDWTCNQGVCEMPVCDGDTDCPIVDGDVEIEDINTPCETLAECPSWYYCDVDGWCKQECLTGCPSGEICDMTMYRCVPDNSDGDMIEGECLSFEDCPPHYYCDTVDWTCKQDCVDNSNCALGFYCTTWGKCDVDLAECVNDDECPKGTFCDESMWRCRFSCLADDFCGEGYECDDRGHCVAVGSIPGEFVFPICVYDEDCPKLSFCDNGICTSTCLPPAVGCADGLICSLQGRCVTPTVDGDVDIDVDAEVDTESETGGGPLACSSLADCPYSSQCLANPLGSDPPMTCQTSCLMDMHCPNGQQCDCLGRCTDTLPDPSVCTGWLSCIDNTGCPASTHCWDGWCRAECLTVPEAGFDFGCQQYYMCDDYGHCVVDPNGDYDVDSSQLLCADDGDCPYHSYCFDPGSGDPAFCFANCTSDSHCPSGKYCNNRGVCVDSVSDWDDGPGYPLCSVDADCESWSYCYNGEYCRTDCIPPANLLCETGTCIKGRCLVK
jgi:hypothetical protein